MVVGIMRLELYLYEVQSLKEKRSVVKKILGRCRVRFPVSCAETDLHDLWQSAELGFSLVERSEARIHTVFTRIQEELDRIGLTETRDTFTEYLHY
ncbi:MAG: DUF503 domain-containing protein [Syntrophotaleaceae bacterium]